MRVEKVGTQVNARYFPNYSRVAVPLSVEPINLWNMYGEIASKQSHIVSYFGLI